MLIRCFAFFLFFTFHLLVTKAITIGWCFSMRRFSLSLWWIFDPCLDLLLLSFICFFLRCIGFSDYGKSYYDVVKSVEHVVENFKSDQVSEPSNFKYWIALEKQVSMMNSLFPRNLMFASLNIMCWVLLFSRVYYYFFVLCFTVDFNYAAFAGSFSKM